MYKKHLWCKYMYSAWDVMANTFKFFEFLLCKKAISELFHILLYEVVPLPIYLQLTLKET